MLSSVVAEILPRWVDYGRKWKQRLSSRQWKWAPSPRRFILDNEEKKKHAIKIEISHTCFSSTHTFCPSSLPSVWQLTIIFTQTTLRCSVWCSGVICVKVPDHVLQTSHHRQSRWHFGVAVIMLMAVFKVSLNPRGSLCPKSIISGSYQGVGFQDSRLQQFFVRQVSVGKMRGEGRN